VLGGSLVTLNPLPLVTSSGSRFLKEIFFGNEIIVGLGYLKDYKEPASFFKQLAKKGQLKEIFFGNEIIVGLGYLKDYKEPASFFKQLAKKGQFRVGYLTSSLSFF